MTEPTKTELTEGFTMWKQGAHTVTSLETQAIKLWAGAAAEYLGKFPAKGDETAALKVLTDFLQAAHSEQDHEIALALLGAKERELKAGRAPASADAIPQ